MGRLLSALALTLLAAALPVRAGAQQDPIPAALVALEQALRSGSISARAGVEGPTIAPEAQAQLLALVAAGPVSTAAIRERSRAGGVVFAEVFVGYGTRGLVASWLLDFAAGPRPGQLELRTITEVGRFDDLVRLSLDQARQYSATNLVISGPDFTLSMPSGVAFASTIDGDATALVLRGRAQVRFTPADEAERGQLRVFAGTPDLEVMTDEVFVRLNPDNIGEWVTGSLVPAPLNLQAAQRAREIFDSRSALSQEIDLGDLAPGRWTVSPSTGNLVVDFRTSRDTWLTYSRAAQSYEDISLIDADRRKQISLYRSTGPRLDLGRPPGTEGPFQVSHTDLDLVFDPSRLWLTGRGSLRIAVRAPISSLSLGLARTLVVSSVSSPEFGRLMPLRPAGQDSLIVGLPRTLDVGETITVDVHYRGRVRPQPLSGESMSAEADTAQDPSFPGDLPFAVEPRYLYSTGTWWYPQQLSARHAPATVRVTVPATHHALATGSLESTIESAPAPEWWPTLPRAVRSFRYRTDLPVRYLSLLVSRLESIGQAVVPMPEAAASAEAKGDGVTVEVFISPGQSRHIRSTPEKVADVVGFYASRLGGVPYPSLTVAALEDNLPGGHSPAYFTLLNQPHLASPLSWSRDPVAFGDWPDFFLAHEIAHQWFGQAVAGRDYHGRWISEGLAQYLAWLYIAANDADSGARMMVRMRETIGDAPLEGPIHLGPRLGHLRDDRRIFRTIVYNKSSVVLHMLRRLIGDEAFFAGLRRVYAAHRFTLIGVDEVQRAFEAETSLPLARFFEQWIRGADHPQLRLAWSQESVESVTVRVEQVGRAFDVPHDIVIRYADGSSARSTLRLGRQQEAFTLPASGPVRRVDLDDPISIAAIVR